MQHLKDKDEKEIALHSNCKDPKFELCKTALKNILSPTNQLNKAIFEVLKALQKCKVLEITNIHQITDNFIKLSEGLSSELYEISSFISDIIQYFEILSNDTAKANDLIDLLETSLSEPNERMRCVKGLENDLNNIANDLEFKDEVLNSKSCIVFHILYNPNIVNRIAIYEGIKPIKIQFKLLTSFWKTHNYLIDNLVKLLYDTKKSSCMLKFLMDDFEMISLWEKVKVKCEADYGRAMTLL
ncbi:26812_t:CDS:1 [Dentiscutata erythropus]|uniref:26812_t:CDS:1 n=1 Tax=Dentiscutata erythropus TaxID=1348616 RepID=A0A9N9HH23_9GLOM|nr:26812_t:CDS:1 [Dentiscutata erythropus]